MGGRGPVVVFEVVVVVVVAASVVAALSLPIMSVVFFSLSLFSVSVCLVCVLSSFPSVSVCLCVFACLSVPVVCIRVSPSLLPLSPLLRVLLLLPVLCQRVARRAVPCASVCLRVPCCAVLCCPFMFCWWSRSNSLHCDDCHVTAFKQWNGECRWVPKKTLCVKSAIVFFRMFQHPQRDTSFFNGLRIIITISA